MIPQSLVEWDLHAVKRIVDSGIRENDLFDFKANLQPAEHQRKIVAAFANTRGGYLIFGVTDDRKIVGVSNDELPRDFGSKVRTGIEPYVDYTIGVPLPVESGHNVFIVEILRSPRVPHAVQSNGHWAFLKRSSSGSNEPMSYEEIRLAFQDTELKRSKLALVIAELDLIGEMALRLAKDIPEDFAESMLYQWAWMTRYPTNLLDTLLGDASSLISKDKETWGLLSYVRDCVRISNTYSEALSKLVFSAVRGVDPQKKRFQIDQRRIALDLKDKISSAKERIRALLGPEV